MIDYFETTIGHKKNSFTFKVDDVLLSTKEFKSASAKSEIVRGMGRKNPKDETDMCRMRIEPLEPYKVIGCSYDGKILQRDEFESYVHPLLAAVHMAFKNHLPLTFSPDIIWQTILQGMAQHIDNYPEEYRHLFVDFKEKKILTIIREDLSILELDKIGDAVPSIVEEFNVKISEYVNPAYFKIFQSEFSTTTLSERTAARITCMEAFKPCFGYTMICGCGFPQITVLGSALDWQKILNNIIEIEKLFYVSETLNLNWWTEKLKILIEAFISAAMGNPDILFWKSIYKNVNNYLSHSFNGWIGWLWPYVREKDKRDGNTWTKAIKPFGEQNPMLKNIFDKATLVIGGESPWGGYQVDKSGNKILGVEKIIEFNDANQRDITLNPWSEHIKDSAFLSPSEFPLGQSKVDLKIIDVNSGNLETILVGGFIGVTQDEKDFGLTPKIGYALLT